jgi:ribosome-binding protein aMBF1 (putative translation factor)
MTQTITTCDLCGAKMQGSTISVKSPDGQEPFSVTGVTALNFSIEHVDGLKKSVAHVSVSVSKGSELDVCNKCILGKMEAAMNQPISKN